MIKDIYGHNKVAQIGTFGTLQAKSAIQSIAKVLDIPYKTVESIKKGITEGLSVKESLETNQDLREYQELYPKLFEYTTKLEGLERNISTHAGGVVITPEDKTMSDFTAMCISRRDEEICQIDMTNCEEVGLVKMDFLGLSTLDVIYDTYKIIKRTKGIKLELKPDNLEFNDKKTYEMLQKGLTKGVFQLGSKNITEACVDLKPENFEELTNLISLYRPATLQGLDRYIQKKQGLLKIKPIDKRIDPILETTRGELIYQEQMMRLLKAMANFSDGEADHARKISSKKKEEEFEKVMQDFKKRAKENGFNDKVIKTVYDMIKDSASYSFALAHGVSYAMLTYITAYLKANYTTEFMCSLLTNQRKEGSTDMDSLNEYIKECKQLGIKLLNPDIRAENHEFKALEDNKIIYGLDLIKGCNADVLKEIVEKQPSSMEELLDLTCNKNTIVPLIKSGALDHFGERKDLLIELVAYRFYNGKEKKKPLKNPNSTHILKLLNAKKITKEDVPQTKAEEKKMTEEEQKINQRKREKIIKLTTQENKKEVWEEWKDVMDGDNAIWEYEILGYALTGQLFDKTERFENFFDVEKEEVDVPCIVNKIDKRKVKKGSSKGQEMAIMELDTPFGEITSIAFSNVWNRVKYNIDKGNRYIFIGNRKGNDLIMTGVYNYQRYIDNFRS